jgi:CMP-N,N'-diacetyllegionaminic acid synthase
MLSFKVKKKNYIIENNKVWALIPARIGSKTIKRKNLKKILGKTLLEITINTAISCKRIDRIFVSTDSKLITNISIKLGAEVEGLREAKYSTDFSTDLDVFKDFFLKRRYKSLPEFFIYLRPTSPLRNYKILDYAILKFKKKINYDSMVSVHEMSETAYKKFVIKRNLLRPLFKSISLDKANMPRQNFKKTYSGNGYFDIIKTQNIFKNKYLGEKCFPFITKKTLDINSQFDLNLCRLLKKFNYI